MPSSTAEPTRYHSDAVVIAAGGFESSVEKRTRYMGPEYDDMTVHGVRYDTGHQIEMALDIGAKADGNWSGGHLSMVNAEAPDVGSGVHSYHGYHYGIVLNHDGERFLDEGRDWRSKTYANYGHELMKQPHQEGFVFADTRTDDLVVVGEHGYETRIEAETLDGLVNR